MSTILKRYFSGLSLLLALAAGAVNAEVFVQCPGDLNGDGVIDTPDPLHPNAVCMHLTAGDGFVTMADGKLQYIFGFSDVTGTAPDQDACRRARSRRTSRRRLFHSRKATSSI